MDSMQCVQTPASVSQLREEYGDKIKEFRASDYSSLQLPESVDWRTKGAVAMVKDQVRFHMDSKVLYYLCFRPVITIYWGEFFS